MPKISQYTAVTTPADTDELVVNQGGVTKKITMGKLADYVGSKPFTSATDPATDAAATAAIVNAYSGTIITTTKAANSQTLAAPTAITAGKIFIVVNDDTSTHSIPFVANSVTFTLTPGEGQCFIWDGSAWGPTDLGITDIPVKVTQGGTGASTLTDHGVLLGSGTDPVTPLTPLAAGELLVGVGSADPHALAAGAATEILVGGGAGDPVWTAATGSGAPVRATSPTLVTPALGTPASGDLKNCSVATEANKGVTVYSGTTKALAGTDTASAMTPADTKAVLTKNVIKSGSAILTADECTGMAITIYGQTDDVTLTLPTAFAGGSFRVQVSADLAKYIRITPNGSEIQSFDGIDLNAGYYVYLSAATKGAMIQYVAIKTGASSWQWCALTITGQWYAQV